MTYTAANPIYNNRGSLALSSTGTLNTAVYGSPLSQPYTVIYVGSITDRTTGTGCLAFNGGGGIYTVSANTIGFDCGSVVSSYSPAVDNRTPVIWIMIADHAHTQSFQYENSNSPLSGGSRGDPGGNTLSGLLLGGASVSSTGDLCEVIVYDHVLNASEIKAAMIGLANYYALPIVIT